VATTLTLTINGTYVKDDMPTTSTYPPLADDPGIHDP
jgi:hypothetical protein